MPIIRAHGDALIAEAALYEVAVLAHRRDDDDGARALLAIVLARDRDPALRAPARRLLEMLDSI